MGDRMKNVGKSLKKAALASAVALGMLSMSAPAQAYESDPWFRSWQQPFVAQYNAFVTRVDNQFFAINTYLAEIYAYMNSGEGDTGTGIIGTMVKISKMQQQATEEAIAGGAQMNRVTTADALGAQRSAAALPSERACKEVGQVMGARASGGGGGGSRAVKGNFERVIMSNTAGMAPNPIAQAADTYNTHAKNYCGPNDVKFSDGKPHKAFGCTAASTTMPSADVRVQSLFVPAHDFTNPDKAAAANLTFTAEQAQAAADASKNIISAFSPLALSPDMEGTEAGKMYLAKVNAFNARISPAIHALSQITSMRMGEANLPDALAANWKKIADPVYSRIFKGMEAPTKPSESEVMRFEVLRRYADSGPESWHQKQIIDDDLPRLTREMTDAVVLNTYVNWQAMNRLEENNALQSAILAQMTNPVSKIEMERMGTTVYSSQK